MWYILDKEYNTIGALNTGASLDLKILSDSLTIKLEQSVKTIDFTVESKHETVKLLTDENYIVVPNESGENHSLFKIIEVESSNSGIESTTRIYGESSHVHDLSGTPVRPMSLVGNSLREAFEILLAGTDWEVGDIDYNQLYTEDIKDYPTVLQKIFDLTDPIKDCSVDFIVEMVNGTMKSKKVSVVELGEDNGYSFSFDRNLNGLVKKTNIDEIYSAILPLGKSSGSGDDNFLTLARAVQEVKLEEGYEFLGTDTLSHTETKEKWCPSSHRVLVHQDSEAENWLDLFNRAKSKLDEIRLPKVEYSCDIETLDILGYSIDDFEKGDYVTIQDHEFDLYIQARVSEKTVSETDPSTNSLVFSNYKKLDLEKSKYLSSIQSTLLQKENAWNDAVEKAQHALDLTKGTVHVDMSPPEKPEKDKLWLDTSQEPAVLYRWSGSSWVRAGAQGIAGPAGPSGVSLYTWIRYADTETGFGMSNSSAGKKYIGLAYNKASSIESLLPSDYEWTLIKGEKGDTGENAKTIKLTSNSQVFKKEGTSISPSSIVVRSSTQNTQVTTTLFSVNGEAYTSQAPTGVTKESNTVTIIGSLFSYKTLSIKMADGYVEDIMTIAMLENGSDGETTISSVLTNESHTLKASSTGEVASFDGAETSMIVYKGLTEDTLNWKMTASLSSGIVGRISGNKYSIIAMSVDSGYVDLKMTNPEHGSITKRFSLTKSKEGSRGPQGVQGPTGLSGETLYTWVKYANTATGGGMSNLPDGKTFIGIAYNKKVQAESDIPGDYTWSLIQGPQGNQGVEGPKGLNGESLYTWIKYADSPTSGMSDLPSGKKYMGIAYNKTTQSESSAYSDYSWSLVEGPKGSQGPAGIQGPTGPSGVSQYVHIRYSSNVNGNPMSLLPQSDTTHIGLANTTSSVAPTSSSSYTWSLFKGPQGNQGIQGPQGAQTYTWLKYADTVTGSGMSDLPDNKKYIGLAYNKNTSVESSVPSDYTWSLIQGPTGPQGNQGIAGPAGANGKPTYTWIKYADSATGSGISDLPTNKKYIGIAYNKDTAAESSTATDYTWSLIQGPAGPQGSQGVQGPTGANGQTTYTWIKYADSTTSGMSDSPTGKKYMGIAYNKTTQTESSVYTDYNWSLIQGPQGNQGNQGIAGPTGPQGQATYTWVKYADSATGTGLNDSPDGKKYIGLAYNKTTATESNTASDYTWSLIQGPTGPQGSQGIQGPKGSDGQPTYTWIKYADTVTGSGMNDSPTSKKYMGIAYNKTTQTESNTATDYVWSLIQGPQGSQGVPGPTGPQGQATYTWIKYADTPTTGMSDSPTGKKYMGIAYNKTTQTESSSYSDYTWSLIQGPQGNQGLTGPQGSQGNPTYTWVKYADNDSGSGMTDTPEGKRYIGLSFNKNTQTESSKPSDYSWTPLYDNVLVGGRNLIINSRLKEESYNTTEFEASAWASTFLTNEAVKDAMIPGETYTLSYEMELTGRTTIATLNSRSAGLLLYSASGRGNIDTRYTSLSTLGQRVMVNKTFVAPDLSDHQFLIYTNRYTTDGALPAGNDTIKFKNIKLEKGNVKTDFTVAPEDINDLIAAVSVGGRNLIIGSENVTVTSNNGTQYPIESRENLDGSRGFRRTFPEGVTSTVISTYTTFFYDSNVGTEYTTSCKVRPEKDVLLKLYSTGTPILCKAGVWTTISNTSKATSGSTRVYGIYASDITSSNNPWIDYKEFKAERGNRFTDWTLAPEDTQNMLNEKASNDDLDSLSTIVSDLNAQLNEAAKGSELQDLINEFNERVQQEIVDKAKLAEDLSTMDGRTALVEEVVGSAKKVTEFIETKITESDEGILIANGKSGTGILVSDDRISFLDNGVEVAYVSNQTMEIKHGIFVQSATISDFKFEKIPGTEILAITWVGGD